VLPAAALAIPPAALLARVVRLETVRVLGSDYIRTARSKHLPWRFFYLRHVLRNSLTGAIALGNVIFISLIGGSVVIENVFGWPGVGTTLVAAIVARDYPVVQGILLVLGLLILVVNTLVDVVLGVLNPRSVIRDV
jgi:peptide/nickel transport system permease protein